MQVYLFFALLFLATIITFIFQNNTLVTVQFLGWVSPKASVAIVALIAACGGALVTFLLDSVRYFKIAKRIKELVNHNKKLQDEIDKIKKSPSSANTGNSETEE